RHVQSLEDGFDLAFAVLVGDRIDVAETERADEQRAFVAPSHLPRREHAGRPDLDLESGRQLDLLDQRRELRFGGAGRWSRWRRQTFLRLGLVAKEPIIRRMGPEFLGAGFIAVQLLLSPDLTDSRNKSDCGDGKNRSTEHRFHCVTPYAADWAARIICFEGFET